MQKSPDPEPSEQNYFQVSYLVGGVTLGMLLMLAAMTMTTVVWVRGGAAEPDNCKGKDDRSLHL